jgi:hypothetical protein
MIIIQTNRKFVVPEESIKNIPIPIPISVKIEQKKEQSTYTKKNVKYFIPEFYI